MLGEHAAVELLDPGPQRDGVSAAVHRPPDLSHERHELLGRVLQAHEQIGKRPLRHQPHVFGEEGKQAADQEPRHAFRVVSRGLEPAGEDRDPARNLAGDLRRPPRGVEGQRIEPERLQPLANRGVAEGVEREAMAASIRKCGVHLAEPGEVGV
jgi:hypothetical protein